GKLARGSKEMGAVFSYLWVQSIVKEARTHGASANWARILAEFSGPISIDLDSGKQTDSQHPRVEAKVVYDAPSTSESTNLALQLGRAAPRSAPATERPCAKGSVVRTIGVSKFCVYAPHKSNECRTGFRRRTVKSKKGRRRLCVRMLKDLKAPVARINTDANKTLYTSGKCPKGYQASGKKGTLNRCISKVTADGKTRRRCSEGRLVGKGPRAVCLVNPLTLQAPCTPARCAYVVNTRAGVILSPAKRAGQTKTCPEGKYSPEHRMCIISRIKTKVKKQPKVCNTTAMAGKKGEKLLKSGTCLYWVENNKARRPGLYRNPIGPMAESSTQSPKQRRPPKRRR
ncbi:MAG: hypothetical protein VX589_02635, partial [Myxococcota bacterium]|nr:hypothetical protein [Myxococcota bacterium]